MREYVQYKATMAVSNIMTSFCSLVTAQTVHQSILLKSDKPVWFWHNSVDFMLICQYKSYCHTHAVKV